VSVKKDSGQILKKEKRRNNMRASGVAFVLCAMVLYGVQNVLQERYYSKVNSFGVMLLMNVPIIAVALVMSLWNGTVRVTLPKELEWSGLLSGGLLIALGCAHILCSFKHQMPIRLGLSPDECKWVLIGSMVLLAANFCCYTGFEMGATAERVTTAMLLVPISASVTKMIKGWAEFNELSMVVWGLGAVMLYVLTLSERATESSPL
jgi:hypothetical protein